ncbi:ion transporter [Rhizobium sp. 'Codium 1']|uniref:ion transporter n=1 Tax=Rhizobium sp. 'Codium 1' TaxID=2940484 RepID=UPI001E33CB3B|nr:ion transporter [Rhizobium sp. 'Codium 1']MCC8932278.1 ion transporter [Rhizobium sp. 'Codium 1']
MRDKLKKVLSSNAWERVIITVILINSVTLGLETSPAVMQVMGPLLLAVDRIILTIFVAEIAARLYTFRFAFFRDPWSIFDFAIVAIALIPASGPFQVLRALRVLRVLRLISIVPSLRRVIGGLIAALPGMGSIIILLFMLFYVSAVMATKLYGATFPDWFGSLGASTYSLFQIMTLESWSMGIVRPVMEVHPYAWLFFVPFILLSTYSVLNLFIGVIVSAMQEQSMADTDADLKTLHIDNADLLREMQALRSEIAALRTERPANGA